MSDENLHPVAPVGARIRHLKRGGEYLAIAHAEAQVSVGIELTVLAEVSAAGNGTTNQGEPSGSPSVKARLLKDGDYLVVYRSLETGKFWARFPDEFTPDRFSLEAAALPTAEADELRARIERTEHPTPVPSHGGPARQILWNLLIAGVSIQSDYVRLAWGAESPQRYRAPEAMVSLCDRLNAALHPAPATAKPDTSAAGAEWGALKQIQSYVMSERTALHPLDPDFNAKYLTLKTVGKRIREILAALSEQKDAT